MAPELDQLESQILDNLNEREVQYQKALALTESLPDCLDTGDYGQSFLSQIHDVLKEVSHLELSCSSVQASWEQLGGKPGPLLAQKLKSVQTQLETLLSRISKAEETATAARQKLAPQISVEVTSQRMRDAYGQAVT